MRIICRLCKKNREIQGTEIPAMLYHTNPDSQKYYCFLSGDLTDSEYRLELKA